MSIKDIRAKFPQYEDVSDEDLVKAVHQKFYSDIPFREFQQKVGLPVDFSFSRMAENIPSSALQTAKNTVEPLFSPRETIVNLGNTFFGLVQKLFPGQQAAEPYADALFDVFKQRYGTGQDALNTLENDPVGVLSDVAGLMTGGGMAASKLPGAAGSIAQGVAKAGGAIDPLNVAINVPKVAAAKILPESLPIGLYESAAKFGTTIPTNERRAMAQTALREQIPLSAEGVTKTRSLINELDSKINNLIIDAERSGKTIPRSAVYQNIRDVRQKLGGPKIEAAKDLATIREITKSFDDYMERIGKTSFTPTELQRFKQDLYNRINFDRSTQTASIPKEETYKALAGAARSELETLAPDIKGINRREGQLLELLPNLERSAARIENRDITSIGPGIKASGGAAVAGDVGAAAGLGASIFDLPRVKSGLALRLAKGQQQGLGGLTDNSLRNMLMRQILLQQGRTDEQGLLD